MTVGIIGYGYWGLNLVRVFFGLEQCRLKSVADARPERLAKLAKTYPSIRACLSADDIINDDEIDAVVIATPVHTHFSLAWSAMIKGKHVLVEKPMSQTVQEAKLLLALSRKMNVVLMVDHTFLYTGAVEKMKKIISEGELGMLQYLDSTRINLGLFQADINVLWDLAPHDISILSYIIDEEPESVNATGITHTGNRIENIAYLTINFKSSFIAHFSCSWSSPVKLRTMLIGGDAKMILYNDLEPSEKVKVYDTGYRYSTDEERKRVMVDYRTGDIYVPKLKTSEALEGMAEDFLNCIINNTIPVSSGELGLRVVRILEASGKSLRSNGREIKISDNERANHQFSNVEFEER